MTEHSFPLQSVLIVGREYKVIVDTELTDEDVQGSINHLRREIRLAPANVEDMREALWHEVKHGIEERDDIKITHKALRMMSIHEDVFLAENPGFVKLYDSS